MFIINPFTSNASNPFTGSGKTFALVYGDGDQNLTSEYGQEAAYDSQGNIIWIGGYSDYDIAWLMKTDKNGTILWKRFITGDIDQYINGETVSIDADNNIIVGIQDWDSYRACIMKFDSSGNLLWQRVCNFPDLVGTANIAGIDVDTDGSFYVLYNLTGSTTMGYLVKYDSAGSVLWGRSLGDTGTSRPKDVKVDRNHNVIVSCKYIFKFNSVGVFQWQAECNSSTELGAVAVDSFDSIYVIDNITGNLLKISSNGAALWGRGFSGVTLVGVTIDAYDRIFVTGRGTSQVNVMRYTISSDLVWQRYITDVNNSMSYVYDYSVGLISTKGPSLTVTGYSGLWGGSSPDGFFVQMDVNNPKIGQCGKFDFRETTFSQNLISFSTNLYAPTLALVTSTSDTSGYSISNVPHEGTQDHKYNFGDFDVQFTASAFIGVNPLAVTFTDQTPFSPTSWFWEFGDGSTSTDQNPTHVYNVSGIYSVTLTVSDGVYSTTRTKTDFIFITSLTDPLIAPMTLTVDTAASGVNTLELPIAKDSRILIDWGDGNTTQSDGSTLPSHTYANGQYTVKIYGRTSHYGYNVWFYGNITSPKGMITACTSWGALGVTSLKRAFSRESKLTSVPSSLPTTVTNITGIFEQCSTFNQDISMWNTSNVTAMADVFSGASIFNQPLNSWDVSNVTNMRGMFRQASAFNQLLSSWNTSKVTDMGEMFLLATVFNQSVNSWDVSSVTKFDSMFGYAEQFNQSLNNWNMSNAKETSFMFGGAFAFNQNIGGWNTSNVYDMSNMFFNAFAFNQNISGWNTSKVTNMAGMFLGAQTYNQPLNSWNVSNVTTMRGMFQNAWLFNQPLNSWNVSNVTDMSNLFAIAESFDQDISAWNTSKVTDMSWIFNGATVFNQPIGSWNVNNVGNMKRAFYGAADFVQNISAWNLPKIPTEPTDMFTLCPIPTNYKPHFGV